MNYLEPATYVDSNHPGIVELANELTSPYQSPTEKAVTLYYFVRDEYFYDPYKIDLSEDALKASSMLERNYGYCGEKACLLAALGRAAGIPSRLGFARVTNHIGTERLEQILQSNELVFHGFTEFYLNEKWVKCTPAFNKALCTKLGVDVMEFDGKHDSIFQEFDKSGGKFMEYTHDYGSFHDIPRELMLDELKRFYPHVFEMKGYNTPEAYFLLGEE